MGAPDASLLAPAPNAFIDASRYPCRLYGDLCKSPFILFWKLQKIGCARRLQHRPPAQLLHRRQQVYHFERFSHLLAPKPMQQCPTLRIYYQPRKQCNNATRWGISSSLAPAPNAFVYVSWYFLFVCFFFSSSVGSAGTPIRPYAIACRRVYGYPFQGSSRNPSVILCVIPPSQMKSDQLTLGTRSLGVWTNREPL